MIKAVALVCSLKPSPEASSSELIANQLLTRLAKHGVEGESIRVVDFDVKPGVETDMGEGDDWPRIRGKVLTADILIISTPIWMGHTSSIADRVLERLDAELSETDAQGRPILSDKVAVVTVVGNEDGAHAVCANVFQALNDVGFSIPRQSGAYWIGEAMGDVDYKDLDEAPEKVLETLDAVAASSAHLASVLRESPYPA